MSKFKSKNFKNSMFYALNGIRLAYRSQRNFRKHLVITSFTLILGILFKLNVLEFCIILTCATIVLIAEMFNSVAEFIIDAYYRNKWARLAKISKDIAAGAVLLASTLSAIIVSLIFLSKVLKIYPIFDFI